MEAGREIWWNFIEDLTIFFLLRPLTDSEALPVQRHRNADNLKSPQETQAPAVEKKSKKPKKKEKKHKEKEREKEKRKERERKADEGGKKVISLLLPVIFFTIVEELLDGHRCPQGTMKCSLFQTF